MNIQEYISCKKEIQKEILSLFTLDQNGDNVDLEKFTKKIKDQKILDDEHEFRLLLHLISNISKNHHRSPNFFNIIEKILLLFKAEFKKYLSSQELFYIFKDNKRIILMLLENKILEFNDHISYYILYTSTEDSKYFENEIKPHIEEEFYKTVCQNDEIDDENYEQNRKIGENELKICEIIRNDKIDDFVIYVTKNNTSINMEIPKSIYETNFYLIEKVPTLIEYAAFFGSIQIFNYLRLNGANLSPSLWFYVVHGRNPELVHFLESNKIEPENKSYQKVYEESLLCHHNEIADYIKLNYFDKNEDGLYSIVSSHNYEYFPDEEILINQKNKSFCYFCQFDYFYLVKIMLDNIIYDAEFQEYINYKNELYYTPFLGAVLNNNIKIVKLLLNRPEIDINSIAVQIRYSGEHDEMNALRMAIFNYNFDLIELLINHKKIDVNSRLVVKKRYKPEEYTMIVEDIYPISIAISYCDRKIVNLFLQHDKINVNVNYRKVMVFQNDSVTLLANETALSMSFTYANIEMTKLMLSHPKININLESIFKSPNENISINLDFIQNILCYSIDQQNNELAKLLLNCKNIDVNSISICQEKNKSREEKSALYLAVEKENEEIVKELLNHKEIDVNCKYFRIDHSNSENEEKSILQFAFEKGNENIIKLLLSNSNIDINVKSLLKRKFINDVEVIEKTTLSYAVDYENIEIMKILLENPELNLKLKNKRTLINTNHHKCEEKNILDIANINKPKMFQVLLDHLKQLFNTNGDKQSKEIFSKYIK